MADRAAPPTADAPHGASELILAARLYYIDGLSQSQIAKMVGTSQAKVSRLLAAAREQGIVQISVPEYQPRDEAVEQAVRQRFGLTAAIVVRRLENQTADDLRNAMGYFAAPHVSAQIAPSMTVAVAGGRTLRCLADRMQPPDRGAPVTVVQGMGNIDETPGVYDALEIGRVLARRWAGLLLTINTPAILPDPEVCRQFLAVGQVRNVFERLAKADLALVGVGNLQNSVFVERGVLKPRDIELLKECGAVGEIVGRFYDSDGRECESPFRHRVISIGLDTLRRNQRVIGIVAGSDRTEALLGAIRGGILKTLIIDDIAAQALLAAMPSRLKRPSRSGRKPNRSA